MIITKAQVKVIKMMEDGWELGYVPTTIGKTACLYKGTVENWERIENVSYKTLQCLLRHNFIRKYANYFTIEKYKLTAVFFNLKPCTI